MLMECAVATRRSKKIKKARWKPKKRGEPNKLEQRHRDTVIADGIKSGEYVDCLYEAVSFSISHNEERIVYTPDWLILRADGEIEIHEVKGAIYRGDSRVRLRLAASRYYWINWKAYVYSGSKPPEVEVL